MDNTVVRNTTMVTERNMNMNMNEWSNRRVPSSGVGIDISSAETVAHALHMGGLDYQVATRPIYTENGTEIPKYRRILRTDSNKTFGVVKDNYKPIQNAEAFAFADALVNKGARLDRMGGLKDGEFVWMQLTLPETKVNNEPYTPYVFLSTGHDGKHGMMASLGAFRAFCCNQIRLVMAHSDYHVNVNHKGDVMLKVQEANRVMAESNSYIDQFKQVASDLRNTTLANTEVDTIINRLVPITDKDRESEKTVDALIEERNRIRYIYVNAPDLQNEGYNGYRLLNAVSDYESHWTPQRNTRTWRDNRLVKLNTSKATMTNKVFELLR